MRYSHYKPTGIPWLPEIPEGWEMRRVASLLKVKDCPNAPNEELLSVFLDRGVIRFSEGGDKRANATSKDLGKYQLVEVDDFVMNNQQAWRGSVGVSKYRGIISPAYFVVQMSDCLDARYADFALRSRPYVNVYEICSRGVGSIQRNLIWNMFKQRHFPLPPLSTQRAIVAFLDEKCGKVNRLVAAKEKEVALLKELKQSIVSECVTSGLAHKDLIEPTGVFWQPMMPEGWSVKKCRHALRKLNRSRPQGAELLVCTNKGTVNKRGDAKIGLVSDDETIYQGVAKGDLLIHGMDTWHGAIAVSKFDGMCTPVVHVCDSSESKEFVAYCFQNMARGRLFKLISNGVRQNTSDFRSWEKVAQLPLILPPLAEQREIVAHIEARAAKMGAAAAGIEKEIAALKEYKQRLIADVVTGQRRVA